jgi:outer membrane protein TolC
MSFVRVGFVVFSLALPPAAAGQSASDTLRLDAAVATARSANPKLQAARLGADAAAERISQAGALPDPQLTVGFMNRPLSGFGTAEPMTMNQVQVSQRLPWPGKLGFSEDRARLLASAEAFSADDVEARLISQVRAVYYMLAATDRTITILERTRELLRDFFGVSQAMYAVGDGLQQDVLRAQVAVAQMTEDVTVMTQQRVARAARLNALLGQEATTSVGALVLPEVGGPIGPVDSLLAIAVEHRPALQAAYQRVRAADAGYQFARRQLYPDFMVSLAWGQRPQFGDMGTLMFGISLPLWARSKQLPLRREMEALRTREEALAQDLYNETFAQLTEAHAEAERARALTTLYSTAILPQARASVESALSAYRVGRVDYMTLVENEMTVNRYEVELVRIAAQYHEALARIDFLLGVQGGGQ